MSAPCCICRVEPVKDRFTESCAGCESVWKLVCTSADEVTGNLKRNTYDVPTLRAALDYELRNSRRATFTTALTRALRKAGAR